MALILVLSITMWNLLRAWTALAWRVALTEFAGGDLFEAAVISGAGWSLAGIFIAWALLRRKKWAGKILAGVSIAYSIWYWVARLLWQPPRPNWAFAVIVNLLTLAFVAFILKSLSREAYERNVENPKVT